MSKLVERKKEDLYKYFDPVFLFNYFWKHKELIRQFTKREVQARYKGTFLGIFWSILTPLLMLSVYTFVFSVVFKGRWGIESGNKFEFAIILFSGLTLFNIFTESLNKSPSLIVGNANYVKKVVFPLEILPVVSLLSTLIHALVSGLILIFAVNIFIGLSSWQTITAVLSIFPMIMLTLGFSFIVSALGVYIRDIAYSIVVITNVLVYLTPVFYPISAVPEFVRRIMYFNPLTIIVENFRNSVISSALPNWGELILVMIISYFIMVIGLILFKKLSRGFSDVL